MSFRFIPRKFRRRDRLFTISRRHEVTALYSINPKRIAEGALIRYSDREDPETDSPLEAWYKKYTAGSGLDAR